MHISFVIPGEPQGKGRPRFANIKGKMITRTPDQTVFYENLIKTEYERQCGEQRFSDGDMLDLRIRAFYAIPASASKTRRYQMEHGIIRPTKKPDADNVIKVVADSLNNIAYRDDAQIVDCQIRKYFASEPRVEVMIVKID